MTNGQGIGEVEFSCRKKDFVLMLSWEPLWNARLPLNSFVLRDFVESCGSGRRDCFWR